MSKPILVIEDDLPIRESLVDILQDLGYTVWSASNGQEGLDLLHRSTELPGLVLLDIMMPVLDGYGFRRAQIGNARLADIPTVVLSADGQISEKAGTVGVTEFVKKPIDLDRLFSLAQKYCA